MFKVSRSVLDNQPGVSNEKIDVLVPPPRRIRSFEDFPLPVVARIRGRSRDLSLTVTSGASSDQWSLRTSRSRSDHCYIFHSRALHHTGSWTLRLYIQDESENLLALKYHAWIELNPLCVMPFRDPKRSNSSSL